MDMVSFHSNKTLTRTASRVLTYNTDNLSSIPRTYMVSSHVHTHALAHGCRHAQMCTSVYTNTNIHTHTSKYKTVYFGKKTQMNPKKSTYLLEK